MTRSSFGRATTSSKKIRTRSTQSTPTARVIENKLLSSQGIRENIARSNAVRRQQCNNSLGHSYENFEDHLHDMGPFESEHDLQDVVDGSATLDMSHAGGEFEHLLAECYEDDEVTHRGSKPKYKDYRTRRDRTERRTEGFARQMEGITEAYIEWANRLGDSALVQGPVLSDDGDVESCITLRVMDAYHTYSLSVNVCKEDVNVPAAIVRHGLLPTAPLKPHSAFSIRVMELFRISHLRCPHMTVEPFVKTLCDLHRIPFRQYLAQQFTIAYDLYSEIRINVQTRVNVALGRDADKWRLKNACPACTYKLEQEDDLIFQMLVTMDGNDSLKRLRCTAKGSATDDEGQPPPLGESRGRHDTRKIPGDRYLTREEVDRWAKESLAEILPEDASQEEVEENPCAGRWTNMINDITAKMWGIFDETGVFLALCRHGFTLVIADMIQSGELSKYGLAVICALLDAFGKGLGAGYDIGCKFKTTVNQSELGERARQLGFQALVGAFHGHAHNRICQLSHLATYVKGLGLEDLEGCERFFSKSNHLAASVRYATPFHRQQKIVQFMAHTDAFETEQKSSEFLVNNYKQALQILDTRKALEKTMADQGIESTDVFHQWLEEEKRYLTSLSKEPVEETQEMAYYQALVKHNDANVKLAEIKSTWVVVDPNAAAAKTSGVKRSSPAIKLRHTRDLVERTLLAVEEMETQLGIVKRWTREDDEWKAAAIMFGRRNYQRCLDDLERLIVSRMFELTKMNMSQTGADFFFPCIVPITHCTQGYKLRKHIGKALKSRSQAIRTSLERYNAAAAKMSPRRETLSWDQVVEYAFLADFDLLRDCRQDISERPWARPSARLAMDQYFKIQRAEEEIQRLNIEIKRVITHMQDEEAFLSAKAIEVAGANPSLAHQILLYREERTRFYKIHRRRFQKLARNPLFTGSIAPGVPIDKALLVSDAMDVDEDHFDASDVDKERDMEEEQEEEEIWQTRVEEEEQGAVGALAETLDAFSIAAG
ncbi:hypothetical protein H0H93_016281 [Arthromyces matolae]|nr:hypothetical protein H0H93_016281 [Arthromyces matolae]